jgi:hypothetical protein
MFTPAVRDDRPDLDDGPITQSSAREYLEGRHHRIADGLHDGALFGAYDLLKQPEMLSDEIEGNEITDPGIKFGRAFEVAEQESKAQDLETLADGERIGPIDVAEGLIGEEALRGKYRLAPLQSNDWFATPGCCGIATLAAFRFAAGYLSNGSPLNWNARDPSRLASEGVRVCQKAASEDRASAHPCRWSPPLDHPRALTASC